MNPFLKRIILLVLSVLTSTYLHAGEFIVVLDPGHGGKDAGCVGRKTNEKTIVLDIARRIGKKLEKNNPEIKVVYTRNDDRFISLQGRADIANKAHGNLFLSIHVNSVAENSPGRKNVNGIAIYTLGPDKTSRNLEVAMRENSVMELEPDFSKRYKGFDPKSAESYIVFEMTSSMYLRQSIDFAQKALFNLISTTGRADKGVHQAGFWVLWSPNMPSVLAELEFICNPASENFLCSEDGKEKCAEALYSSIVNYAKDFQRKNNDHSSPDKVSPVKTNSKEKNRNRKSSRSDRKARK